MVNTTRYLRVYTDFNFIRSLTIEAEYADSDIFNLQAQSPGFTLDAILCEQGNILNLYLYW